MDIEGLKGAICPDCNGGGVYQEYDEYDRYTVHACATCDGSGSIANQPSDEGRFPDEAEREYNANYEAKCKKTGINLLAEPSDADVRAALEDLEEAEREDNRIYYCGNVQKSAHELNIETIWWSITALRQMRTEPCWYCKGIELHNIKSVKTVTDEFDRELGAYDTPYNYCSNCGRRLEDRVDDPA